MVAHDHQELRSSPALLFAPTVPFAVNAVVVILGYQSVFLLRGVLASCTLAALAALFYSHRMQGRAASVGAVVLHTGILFWFYLPALATAFSSHQWNKRAAAISITNDEAWTALFLVSVFYAIAGSTYALIALRRPGRYTVRLRSADLDPSTRTLLVASAIAVAISLGFYFVVSGSVSAVLSAVQGLRRVDKPWQPSSVLGNELTAGHQLAYSVLVVVGAFMVGLLFIRRQRYVTPPARLAAGTLLAIATAWVALNTGTRTSLLLIFLPGLFLTYRYRHDAGMGWQRRHYAAAVLVAVLLVPAGSALQFYRYEHSQEIQGTWRPFSVMGNDFLTATAYSVALHDRQDRHVRDNPFIQLIVGPVPRSVWKDKPYLDSLVVYTQHTWGVDILKKGGNDLPSVVGQFYLGWGLAGVLVVGLFYGACLRLADATFARSDSLTAGILHGLFVTYLLISMRTLSASFWFPVLLAGTVLIWRASRTEFASP